VDRVKCPQCPNTAVLDLAAIHEPDRVCWDCKSPWVPEDYEGQMIVENATITPEQAWAWLLEIDDDAGHWTLSRPAMVKRYAGDMRGGWWEDQLIGFPGAVEHAVTFDCHGRLLMGVLRFMACVQADVPLRAVMRRFDPVVPGGVGFVWRQSRRRQPALLGYWQRLREKTLARRDGCHLDI